MKRLILAAVAVLAWSQASAAVICTGCDYLDASAGTFLGALDPTGQDQATFTNTQMAPGAFEDFWVFDLAPAGQATLNAIFSPMDFVFDFTVSLFADDGSVCAAGSCSSINFNPTAIASDTDGGFFNIDFTPLEAGRYVFVISGNVIDGPSAESYSGNMNTFAGAVGEPGTLMLIAFGLLGLGYVCRRYPAGHFRSDGMDDRP